MSLLEIQEDTPPTPAAAHPVKTKHNDLQGKRQRIMRIECDHRHRASENIIYVYIFNIFGIFL